jgi:hypothetical protein
MGFGLVWRDGTIQLDDIQLCSGLGGIRVDLAVVKMDQERLDT